MKILEVMNTKSHKKILREASTVPQAVVRPVGNQFMVTLDDPNRTVLLFDQQADADQFKDDWQRGKPGLIASNQSKIQTGFSKGNLIARANQFEEFLKKTPWIRKAWDNRIFQTVLKFAPAAGFSVAIWQGILVSIEEIKNDSTLSEEEKNREIDILIGMFWTELIFVLRFIFKQTTVLKNFLQAFRVVVRTAQAGLFATGVGAIPSIVSALVTEAGYFVALYALSNPDVQRYFSTWLADYMIGDFFVWFGTKAVPGLAAALNELTGGLIGSPNINRWFGLKEGPAVDWGKADYVASAEWAKLIFKGILFKDKTNVKVPYINPETRTQLLTTTINNFFRLTDQPVAANGETENVPVSPGGARPEGPASGMPAASPEARRDVSAFGSAQRAASWRTREQSLRTDYSNPSVTRNQPFTGPR